MSSVGLSDIPRTTSFRLALLFLGLFGTASLGVFGFLYWQTAGYLASGVDDWLGRELTARSAEHSSELRRQLDAHTLLDPAGRRRRRVGPTRGRRPQRNSESAEHRR